MACNGVAEDESEIMYKIKPYYDTDAPIQLSDCMYKLDSVYRDKTHSGSDSTDMSVSKEVAELEKRQDRILARLEELRHQVASLVGDGASVAPLASVCTLQTAAQQAPRVQPQAPRVQPQAPRVQPQCSNSLPPKQPCRGATDVIEDIVITADPSHPPLALFVLQDLLSRQYSVLSTYYVHSSAKSKVPARVQDVLRTDGMAGNRNAYQIGFTVIWKDEADGPTLVVSPNVQTAVRRECNIARHLARLLAPRYDQLDPVAATQIDAMIDVAASILRSDASKMAANVKVVSAKLGKSRWIMGGEEPTLADIVVWSALQQSGQVARAPDNVRRWADACNQRAEFAVARQLI